MDIIYQPGENFYMNHNCTILDSVKVEFGDNVTIGAGSIVTKDISSNVVAFRNPCLFCCNMKKVSF